LTILKFRYLLGYTALNPRFAEGNSLVCIPPDAANILGAFFRALRAVDPMTVLTGS
jgi:hypothetical protein